MQLQSIFITHRFCIWGLASPLKLISSPTVSTHDAFTAMCEQVQRGEKFESPDAHVPN